MVPTATRGVPRDCDNEHLFDQVGAPVDDLRVLREVGGVFTGHEHAGNLNRNILARISHTRPGSGVRKPVRA